MNPLPFGEHKFPQGDSDFSQVPYLPSHSVSAAAAAAAAASEYRHYNSRAPEPTIQLHSSYHVSSVAVPNSYHGDISTTAAGGVGVSSNGLVDPSSASLVESHRGYTAGETREEETKDGSHSRLSQFGGRGGQTQQGCSGPDGYSEPPGHGDPAGSVCDVVVSPSSVLSSLSSAAASLSAMALPSIAGAGGGGGGGKQHHPQNLERGVHGSIGGSSPSSLEDSSLCRPTSVTTAMTCLTNYNHHHHHHHHHQHQHQHQHDHQHQPHQHQSHQLQTPHHLLQHHHQRHLQQLSPNSAPVGGLSSPSAQSPYPGDVPGGPGGSPLGAGDDSSGDGVGGGGGGLGGVQPIIYPWMRKSQSGKSLESKL